MSSFSELTSFVSPFPNNPSKTLCHDHTSLSPSDEDFSIDATAVHKGAKKVIMIVCEGQISCLETTQIEINEFQIYEAENGCWDQL